MTPEERVKEIQNKIDDGYGNGVFTKPLSQVLTYAEIQFLLTRVKEVTLELKSFVVLWEELDGEKSAGVYLDSRRFRESRNTLEGK